MLVKLDLKVLAFMKIKISYILILGPDQSTLGPVCVRTRTGRKEKGKLDIEYVLKLIANNGFPLVLSVYLVWKLEFFINEIIKNQKEFSHSITAEIKEIKQTINELRIDFAKNQ